jgi:hypothetical protein
MIMTGKTQLDLDSEKLQLKKAEYKPLIEARLEELLSVGVPYKGYHIQARDKDKSNLSGVIISSTESDFPSVWRTYENFNLEIESLQELKDIALELRNFVNTEYMKVWIAKDNIDNASTIEEIETIYNNYVGE